MVSSAPQEMSCTLAESSSKVAVPSADLRQRKPLTSLVHWIGSRVEWSVGFVTLVLALALMAAIPIVNFLTLGYMLESSARVARHGRLRDGLIGVRRLARVGTLVLGTWIVLLPIRFVSEMWATSELIDPGSDTTAGLGLLLLIMIALGAIHIVWAWRRGGRLRHCFWPAPITFVKRLFRRGHFRQSRDAVWEFIAALRLPYYFWLGMRGFFATLVWLVPPISIMAIASNLPPAPAALLSLVGGLILSYVLLHLPFLQTHFALENRFRALFDLGMVRQLFRKAPLAFWFALLVTLLSALPLYLLKIELTSPEVTWLPSLVFVIFLMPARILTGWALGRARRHTQPRFFLFRWMSRLAALPVVATYVFIVYFTQYVSWYGVWSLYAQHAFLVPVPFLAM